MVLPRRLVDDVVVTYRITVVCTGNICRSPMAEWVLRERFEAAGLGDRVAVDSAGTTAWEEGNPADPRTIAAMHRHGHTGDYAQHRARVFDKRWFADRDLVLAADHGHYTVLRRLAGVPEAKDRIRMIRSFDPAGLKGDALVIDDPWYGDRADFEATLEQVEAAADAIVEQQTQMRYYLAEISITQEARDKLGAVEILPGMPVESYIRTGDRSPLVYLTKPLADYFAKAFREG